jgi:23S rRNA (adenine2503-C2)-methyltransferase
MITRAIQTALDGSKKFRFTDASNLAWEAAHFHVPGRERPHIACISTQIGCATGCLFCATATEKFRRNLTSGEMLLEVVTAIEEATPSTSKEESWEVSFMGMGEPLANLKNLLEAIESIHDRYPGISRVSVSSSGPAPRIDALTEAVPAAIPVHLQISLHATTTEMRQQLVPGGGKSLSDLIEAGRRFHDKTGDQVCLNYVLLADRNDQPEDVRWLGSLDAKAFYVKLSELNPVPGIPGELQAASRARLAEVAEALRSMGMTTKVFFGNGLDVQASCGQMAATPWELKKDDHGELIAC